MKTLTREDIVNTAKENGGVLEINKLFKKYEIVTIQDKLAVATLLIHNQDLFKDCIENGKVVLKE